MKITKKVIPLILATGLILSGCGATHHHTKKIPQHILNTRVSKQVHQLNQKDHKLSIVKFNRHKQLIIYKAYRIRDIERVQDMSARQTAHIEKVTKDHKLTPKVVMYHMSRKQKREIKNHNILKHVKAINELRADIHMQNEQIAMQKTQEQSLMKNKTNNNQIQTNDTQQSNTNNNNTNNNSNSQSNNTQPRHSIKAIHHAHHFRLLRNHRR